jgi:hypothetical protein
MSADSAQVQLGNISKQEELIESNASLSPQYKALCEQLDHFWEINGRKPPQSFSDMFRGAMYLIDSQPKQTLNPDWMYQAAHSLREITYHFFNNTEKQVRQEKFRDYGSISYDEKLKIEIEHFSGFFQSFSHHNEQEAISRHKLFDENVKTITSKIFIDTVHRYIGVLSRALRRQLDAHKEIDSYLQGFPAQASLEVAQELVNLNFDARQYFFSQATDDWFSWFWDNGLLNKIKEIEKDENSSRYRLPELSYLAKVITTRPEEVVNFMVSVPLNPQLSEVIAQFALMCDDLPAEQLAKVVGKIKDEHWIEILGDKRHWEFVYKKMFKTLAEVNDDESILTLSSALLVEEKDDSEDSRSPFLLSNLLETKVFKHLSEIGDENLERTIRLLATKLNLIANREEPTNGKEAFPFSDSYHLFNTDFFTMQPSGGEDSFHQGNVHDLLATILVLMRRLMIKQNQSYVRKIYSECFQQLPLTRLTWRLQMTILSFQPESFKRELEQELFRFLDTKNYREMMIGTEYQKTLSKGFQILAETKKRKYVSQVILMFSDNQKDDGELDRTTAYGSKILSMIGDHLTSKEKRDAKSKGFSVSESYKPTPAIGAVQSGMVVAKGPVSLEEFNELSINEILNKLKNEWSPKQLKQSRKSEDFFNPLNAEGTGDLIKKDIALRPSEYAKQATTFFQPKELDLHYTYSFIQGMIDALKENQNLSTKNYWHGALRICTAIINNNSMNKRGEDRVGSEWLADWKSIHRVITDMILELLKERNESSLILFKHFRDEMLTIISYLLTYPDPIEKDEHLDTAQSKTKSPDSAEYRVSDPHFMAINSVRGRAFEALAFFNYFDGKKFQSGSKKRISRDVKDIYEQVVLSEKTRALFFMFGRYLPTFYFADINWAKKQMKSIFPMDTNKLSLYSAAWEGFLSADLYIEMFKDPSIQQLYTNGLATNGEENAEQEHSKNPLQGIAEHLALAFIYFDQFGEGYKLFDEIWLNSNSKLQASFIHAIGYRLTGSESSALTHLKKYPQTIQKLKKLWEWVVNNCDEKNVLTEFGHWISVENEVFETKWLAEQVAKTIEKTSGDFEWDYGLTQSIVLFSQTNQKAALKIARLFLLDKANKQKTGDWFYSDEEWIEALGLLYQQHDTSSDTRNLINELISIGGNSFWEFKKVFERET